MLQILKDLSLLSIAGIVAAIVLAAILIYTLVRWLPARKRHAGRGIAETGTEISPAKAGTPAATDALPDPRTIAKIRAGREGNRPSEDDIARERMGTGLQSGEAAPASTLDESITQIPKGLDPGHTA